MQAAARPYFMGSVALVASSIIAVHPVAPPLPNIHIENLAARLAAASSSIENIPANLINAIANIPANELAGLQELADALDNAGSWWVVSPTNVLGWDPGNPAMMKGVVDALLPFPALSGPLADELNVIAEAELPTNAGCSETIAADCTDLPALLKVMFTVPLWQFFTPPGYTFPVINNPIGGLPLPWSGQTYLLDPFGPITSLVTSLMEPPTASGIKSVTVSDVVTTVTNLLKSFNVAFNPFVPGTACTICAPFVPKTAVPNSATSIPSFTPKVGLFKMNAAPAPDTDDVGPDGAVTAPKAVPDTVRAPDAGPGDAAADVKPTTAASASKVMRGGDEPEPGQVGGTDTSTGHARSGAAKSITDRISSAMSKATGGVNGHGANAGAAHSGRHRK